MLKDFFKNMFTDDEDYDDEFEEEEEEDLEVEPEVIRETTVEDEPLFVAPTIEAVQPNTYIHDETMEKAAPAPAETSKSLFSGLDVDDIAAAPADKKSTANNSSKPYRFDRNKVAKPRVHRQESTEYQAVISPIFGNVEEEEQQFDKVHNAIDLPKPSADFDFVQIISPMYGSEIPSSKPVDSIPEYPEVIEQPAAPAKKPNYSDNDFNVSELITDAKKED